MDEVTQSFAQLVRKDLKENVKKIILYGSRARGDSHEWSDYDFIVIVNEKNKETIDLIDNISGELFYESDKLIGSMVWNEAEWEIKKKFPLGINIIKDGKEI